MCLRFRWITGSSPLVSGLIQWALWRPSDDVGYEQIEPIDVNGGVNLVQRAA